MARKAEFPPRVREHARGLAVVYYRGKNYYLGKYGSPEADLAYKEFLARVLAGDPPAPPPAAQDAPVTVGEVVARWLAEEAPRYSERGRERTQFKYSLRPLLALAADRPAAVHQLLADLVRSGGVPASLAAEAAGGGWAVSVVVRPCGAAPPPNPGTTECQRDVLAVLSAGGRRTTQEVLAELERRGLVWGERTAKGALAELVRQGRVLSSRKSPRGYYLPGVAEAG